MTLMEIIKILKDYSKNPLENKMYEYLSSSLDSTLCREPIKNKNFMIQYIKPLNDFIISSTAMAFADTKKVPN